MKFSMTKTTKNWYGTTLFQIEATASFGYVSKGELGGYVEKESNYHKMVMLGIKCLTVW